MLEFLVSHDKKELLDLLKDFIEEDQCRLQEELIAIFLEVEYLRQ